MRPGPADTFEPYFVASCDCDWTGGARATREEAFADARAHAANVAPAVERPVG